ncbi:hypothetical protein AB6735_24180 [Mucilaginibacter sp. RCC_168]|uniref:hypothetical protein n=1 Tax=Mucilaginibacter sp. RCC_168 TaxID=3239221 RepID=UPI0035236A9F
MYILEVANGAQHPAQVSPVLPADFRNITVKRYVFRWRPLVADCELYKLTITGSDDILGLVALIEHPAEQRIEIKLLTASSENIGQGKQFDRVAGCLIAFAAQEAMDRFEDFPAISLLPKTNLKQHYMNHYGMEDSGRQLYLEDIGLFNVINEYLA